jgi:hypothetical protein
LPHTAALPGNPEYKKGEASMKSCLWKMAIACVFAGLCVGNPAKAQDKDNDGCSNATLHGDYAFTVHGESLGVLVPGVPPAPPAPAKLFPFANPLLADGVAMTHFDGNGGLEQVDFVMRNGTSAATPITPTTDNGFRSGETGTYAVSPDCTGTFKITFADTSEIDVAFVLANQGREIRTVVTRQHVPQLPPAIVPAGANCAAGCDLGVQIRSDGVKLGIVFPTINAQVERKSTPRGPAAAKKSS